MVNITVFGMGHEIRIRMGFGFARCCFFRVGPSLFLQSGPGALSVFLRFANDFAVASVRGLSMEVPSESPMMTAPQTNPSMAAIPSALH